MASKYARRHYEDVAKIMSNYSPATWGFKTEAAEAKDSQANEIVTRFANLFAADNPNFERDRFLKACGF